MELTDEMLAAAMSVAVKTGIFPRYADEETYLDNWHRMKHCLLAALKAADVKSTFPPDACITHIRGVSNSLDNLRVVRKEDE